MTLVAFNKVLDEPTEFDPSAFYLWPNGSGLMRMLLSTNDGEDAREVSVPWANVTHRADFDADIQGIADGAAPLCMDATVSQYYDGAMSGATPTTRAGVADRIELVPFITPRPLRIDRLGISVSTGVASALGRCCIYSANTAGQPGDLLLDPGADLDFATDGLKLHTVDFTFQRHRLYWLGARTSSTAVMRAYPIASARSLGLNGGNGSLYRTVIRRPLAYATALPATWGFDWGELATDDPISVRLRAAAI